MEKSRKWPKLIRQVLYPLWCNGAGRSGRRAGMTATLNFYVRSTWSGPKASLTDLLYLEMVRGIAMVRLKQQGWVEPHNRDLPHLSILAHQVLSLIKEFGGVPTEKLFTILCELGPFRRISRSNLKPY